MNSAQTIRRNELRYRFAELLTQEHFDEALNEALVAFSNGLILKRDLKFVVSIVQSAEKAGRAKIVRTEAIERYFASEQKGSECHKTTGDS